MGIPILVRRHIYIEAPQLAHNRDIWVSFVGSNSDLRLPLSYGMRYRVILDRLKLEGFGSVDVNRS